METQPDIEPSIHPQSESSPLDDHHMLKRLKKKSLSLSSSGTPLIDLESNESVAEPEHDSERGNEWDGLDPLFYDEDHNKAKRALDFDDLGFNDHGEGLSGDDAEFEPENWGTKKKRSGGAEFKDKKKKRRKKETNKSLDSEGKPSVMKKNAIREKKAHREQFADFQRVMRERKGVGFKPLPMVEKPISSVLEKIRQRKIELSKKTMSSKILRHKESLEVMVDDDTEENDYLFELSNSKHEKDASTKADAEPSYVAINPSSSPGKATSDDKPDSNNIIASPEKLVVEEATQPFHPPGDDTQDLFPDSQTSDMQDSQKSNGPSSPAEDIAPSLPSLKLELDSAPPDDILSDENESDKENNKPCSLHFYKGNSSPNGDPVKTFVDEEALEDDSDDDLLKFQDEDEDEDGDMEEIQDYIATDRREKPADHERRNELHQMWLQQQDEAGTENLLQKLKYTTKQREISPFDDENDCRTKHDEEAEFNDEDTEDFHLPSGARLNTKKLKQMILQMFTDKDDGFVSSEDEETEKQLSKTCLLHKVELEKESKFLSPAEDETSREVFSRIKKLNVVPETNKKPNSSCYLDSFFMKGGSSNSLKSSFLCRASGQPMTLSHRQGPSTGRCFIFGRDDSNSRSSISSLSEESSELSQMESQVKRNSSAKFTSSKVKWSTRKAEARNETVAGTSLFEILNRPSMQAARDDPENLISDQAVFAAFKSVKKSIKLEGKS